MATWDCDPVTADEADTLDALFRARVRRTPTAVAYRAYDRQRQGWRDYRWREIGQAVQQWQQALRREPLQAGDRVAIALPNSPQWVIFDQAALGLGLVVVPLYVDDRPNNTAYILEDCGARLLLLVDETHWLTLAGALAGIPTLERILLLEDDAACRFDDPRLRSVAGWLPTPGAEQPPLPPVEPRQLATLIYTSGTTGRPKGVMLSHANILANVHGILSRIEVYRQDLLLSFLPLAHALERTAGYYVPMAAGATVAHGRGIQLLARDLSRQRPTALICVPRVYETLHGRLSRQLMQRGALLAWLFRWAVAVGWHRFQYRQRRAGWHPRLLLWPLLQPLVARPLQQRLGGRLRLAVSGGAALQPEVARRFIGLGIPIVQGYGLTEASPVVSCNTLHDNDPASVGRPLPGVALHIGEQGEVLVRGPNVMLGYWHGRADDPAIDAQGWLHTADQGWLEDGRLHLRGRLKETIVLCNGEKIPPDDLEMAIRLDPLFSQVMLAGSGQPRLVALVVLEPELWREQAIQWGVEPDDAALNDPVVKQLLLARMNGLLKEFPAYATLGRAHFSLIPWRIADGLLTPTLKLKRSQLLERFAGQLRQLQQGS
jgi:long-chain acyl-CoA synthetase